MDFVTRNVLVANAMLANLGSRLSGPPYREAISCRVAEQNFKFAVSSYNPANVASVCLVLSKPGHERHEKISLNSSLRRPTTTPGNIAWRVRWPPDAAQGYSEKERRVPRAKVKAKESIASQTIRHVG